MDPSKKVYLFFMFSEFALSSIRRFVFIFSVFLLVPVSDFPYISFIL